MKWVVFYVFVQTLLVPCPGPSPDEFGRIYADEPVTLAACMEISETPLEKEFNSREEADAFVERASKEPDLSEFKISVRGVSIGSEGLEEEI